MSYTAPEKLPARIATRVPIELRREFHDLCELHGIHPWTAAKNAILDWMDTCKAPAELARVAELMRGEPAEEDEQ